LSALFTPFEFVFVLMPAICAAFAVYGYFVTGYALHYASHEPAVHHAVGEPPA